MLNELLLGGGSMGALVRDFDWSTTSLGPSMQWPVALLVTLGVSLNSRFPTYLAWGPDLISFYNDAYKPILGAKTDALGRPMREVWTEIWDDIGPIIGRALTGEASYFEDRPMVLQRDGSPEQTWWTFSCSPVRNEDNAVGGVLCIVHDTTTRMLYNRRLRFQIDLSNHIRELDDPRQVLASAAERIGRYLGVNRTGYAEVDADGVFMTVDCDWTDGTVPSIARRQRLDDFGPKIEQLKAGRSIRINDVLTDPLLMDAGAARAFAATNARATMVVPVMDASRLVALLYAHQSHPRHWLDEETTLMEEVVEHIRQAVGRARAEAALRESEEIFRLFGEPSTNMLWILNVHRQEFEYRSVAFEMIWGRSRDSFLPGKEDWIETVHVDYRPTVLNAIGRVMRGEASVTYEYRILRPDGSVRWIRDTAFPITSHGGSTNCIAGIAQDITPVTTSLVYVIDPDDTRREYLSRMLRGANYRVQTFAMQAFRDVAAHLLPGCVILGIRRAEASANIALLQEIRARRIDLPVVAVGEPCADIRIAVPVMKAGAIDYLVDHVNPEPVLTAVATALAEIREAASRSHVEELTRARIMEMSSREQQVLQGLLFGATNKEIGRELGISPRTVEIHRARVMERLGARSLPEAVFLATSAGVRPSWPSDLTDQGA